MQLFELTPEEMEVVGSIHKKPGMHRSLVGYHQPDGTVGGWTYEQLGWNWTPEGMVIDN